MENQNPIVKWPYGLATMFVLVAAGAIELSIVNNLTIVDGVSVSATGDRMLSLIPDAELSAGARVVVKTKSTATEKFNPGTNMKGEVITGVAGKTQVVEYVYDGTAFIQTGKFIQID
ncbi:hypothetical protein [Massilibacteroides sp.]|uniref:hypothetical protein n=1 Tax=Massilibacteroides sp. TaxID=2034766 RepID=UPI0026108887|nr:hypothetical protein [Massilibacteroides sp.]MDD4516474.1 hypothetical protein [Massilibacteroides sp.]